MRILHTSDWHLGRTLHGYPLIEDQKYMIDECLKVIKENEIDVFIIAGDIYDKSQPNEEAVALFHDFLRRIILEHKIPTIVISGNHDSQTRLHFGSELFESQQLYMVGETKKGYKKITLNTQEPLDLYLIPYIEPAKVRELSGDETIRHHDDAIRYIVGEINKEKGTHTSIAVAHAFVAGGDLSDSERKLCAVGTAEVVGVDCFKDFTYTALGHLHKPQKIGNEKIRYSGSPLKYSLSEAGHNKGFTYVCIEKGELKEVKQIPLQPKRDLRIIEGPLEELITSGLAVEEKLRNDYVYAKITTSQTQDVVGTLKQVYPYILGAEFITEKERENDKEDRSSYEKKRSQSIAQLFQEFIGFVSDLELEDEEKVYMDDILKLIEEAKDEA